MQKRNLIAILPAAAMLTLAGCGGDSAVISNLKEQTFPADSSLTYEQALDRRAVCASTSWAVSEDTRGREVVRYECDLKGVDDFNDQFAAESGLDPDELSLMSGAIHAIEWFHNDGEYRLSDTRIDLYTDGEVEEAIELNQRISFLIALEDRVDGLQGLLVAVNEAQTPWGW
ncbi:hypothetical protein [Halomonas faecis]|uniref:hypothetical protein n=1 Tax=Halomonas faecis TaxID=1562110 RepID=UPI0013D38DB6|nr:hypothetical protein [Halomonas faecis]